MATNGILSQSIGGSGGGSTSADANYYFHGFAGSQINGDAKFYDKSGLGNDGVFDSGLTNLAAWSNDFYVSTTLASGAGDAHTSSIRIPSLNFDYTGGQKLILWWLGQVATPAGNVDVMGDGINGTYPGVRVRGTSTSHFQLTLFDATHGSGVFGGTSAGSPFDGTLHSFAFMLDGAATKYGMWTDEVYDSGLSGAYQTYSSGTLVNTTNSNTFNIGQAAPAVAASATGIVTLTRALVILRLKAGSSTPALGTLTTLFKQLRADPAKIINAGAI